MIKLDLRIFAYHIHVLSTQLTYDTVSSFSVLPGLIVYFRIVKRPVNMLHWEHVWDTVYLGHYSADDVNDHCGNRYGGIKAYTAIVEQYLHNCNVNSLHSDT